MTAKAGRQRIVEQFLADGMHHMFGNPGTVEQGFLDALRHYPEMKYVLTLQESVAVLMADGYARATHQPTLVQLHSSPGIGNAVGALYQAKRGHAPLVVIAGDAGLRYMNMDAQMAADLVAMMEPVTKYATVVLEPRSLLRTLRRAIKIAATPPMGPVYVCLPMDVLDAPNDEEGRPTSIPSTRTVPEPAILEETAAALIGARTPIIYVGDGVAHSGAADEVAHVAELVGAEVWGVDVGDVCFDSAHPSYQGTTGHMFGAASLPITTRGDVNLVVGTYMVPEVFPELGDIFARQARTIHFDLNAYEIAKNHRVDLGAVCDPKATFAMLAQALEVRLKPDDRQRAAQRVEALRTAKAKRHEEQSAAFAAFEGRTPLHMSQFARVLAERAPRDTIVFDEALTNSPALTHFMPPRRPGDAFVTRGGSLGVGVPGAIGVKIANPERTVVGFSGDGGAMYTIQALWSAPRHRAGAKFVICNNGSYRLLQLNIDAYWKETGIAKHEHPTCFDLSEPPIDFARLAEAMGVAAVRVSRPEEIAPAVDRMLADDEPFLVDLVLEGDVHPELIGVKCGQ